MTRSDPGPDEAFQVAVPVADIEERPGGSRTRQLLFGEPVLPFDETPDHYLIRARRDGYTGYLRKDALCPLRAATHRVTALATHLYARPDLKSRDAATLSFGALLTVTEPAGDFLRTAEGQFVPAIHLAPAHLRFSDPAAVAELFLGTPYLWGGNSRLGIDCSGLVQTACIACGVSCPGDSGDQARELGHPLPGHADPKRGDLIFWRGHVGMMVSARRMIHANGFHMAVAFEDLEEAQARIAEQGGGEITARRRLTLGRGAAA
ncbi:MAG: C40 family peptidase [Pseudomonadota bacterium]